MLWEREADAIAEAVAARGGTLRILLKTRDDPYFLERWIRHHAAIAGLERLVVFDKGSVLPEVLETYRRWRPLGLLVAGFGGWCNALHSTRVFAALYRALARSSAYFCALDTDEFLVLLRDGRHAAGAAVAEFLERAGEAPGHPGLWLTNTDGRDDRFEIGTGEAAMLRPVRGGKPLLRCGAAAGPYINHNAQVAPGLFGPGMRTNFAVLHMVNLSRAQRIATCRMKLVARGFLGAEEPAETVLGRVLDGVTDAAVLKYAGQLRLLLGADPVPRDPTVALRAGCVELLADGTVAGDGARLWEVVERPDLALRWLGGGGADAAA